MGEGEVNTEVIEGVTIGAKSLEKASQDGSEPNEEENGVKEMEVDGKGEEEVDSEKAEKMDENKEVKEDKQAAEEEKKETGDVMGVEKILEEHENKGVMIEEKVGGFEGEMDKLRENEEAKGCKEVTEALKEESEEDNEEAKDGKEKGSKKHVRGKSGGQKTRDKTKKVEEKKELERQTPTAIDRPVRERKSVERLVAIIEKDSVKELHIEKGCGTPLKDIPNVAYKLSRRKTDDTFKLLHTILFGRRGKAVKIKDNISRFSGFVWHENEEKQRMKVKEKFDKCVKEKLLEFCDVLDIPIAKATIKKEDIVAKLLDFLVAPHATTTVLLAEKEKGKKRKRPVKESASKPLAKSLKSGDDTPKKEGKKSTPKTEDDADEEEDEEEEEKENGVCGESEDENSEHSEREKKKDEYQDESQEDEKPKKASKKKYVKTVSAGKDKTKETTSRKKTSSLPKATPKKLPSSHSNIGENSDASPKVFSRKKKNDETTKKSSASKSSTSTEKSGKRAVKSKEKVKEDKVKLSDDELRTAICDILKEVDFNTATFTDILKQLAQKFNTDLTARKSSIKLMIQEELTKFADGADDEDDRDDEDAEKDEAQPA